MPGSRRQTALLMLAIGGHGLAVQVVVMRELMAAYAGNELTAAVVLSVWLGVEALGAWRTGRSGHTHGRLAAVGIAAAVLSALAVPAAIHTRPLFGLMTGEQPGLAVVAGAAALVAALPAFLHGILFVEGCGHYVACAGPAGAGRGYLWEGLGTAAAGVVTAAVLLVAVPGLAVVAGFGILLLLACTGRGAGTLTPSLSCPKTRPGGRGSSRWGAATLGLAVAALALLGLTAGSVERFGWQRAWPGFRVERVRDSWFGKTVSLSREGERTVVYDGITAATFPPTDALGIEQSVVVPALYAAGSGRILILDGNYQAVQPLLRLPGTSVTFVTPDRVLFGELLSAARARDPRLEVVFEDPRRFLGRTGEHYDCIIAPGSPPLSLAANRLATAEFYGLCERRLAPGGLVAVAPPVAVAGIGPVSARLLAQQLTTLKAVFDTVLMLALDSPVFLAGQAVVSSPVEAAARLAGWQREGDGSAALLDSAALMRLLDPFRQERLNLQVAGHQERDEPVPNRDWHPRALFLALAQRSLQSGSPAGLRDPAAAGRTARVAGGTALALLLIAMILAARRGIAARRTLAVASSGFAGTALVALGMFVFQTATGALYAGVVLLLTCFMFGTVAGAWLGSRATGRPGPPAKNLLRGPFLCAEALLLAASLLMAAAGRYLPGWTQFILLAAAGFALGIQFPVAAASCAAGTPPAPGTSPLKPGAVLGWRSAVGRLTAADLTGGIVGGTVVPLLVLPVAGLAWAYFSAVLLKAASLAVQLAPDRRV